MGSYQEDLVLDEKELSETIILKISVPSLVRIYDRCDYFTEILRKAVFDETAKKNLAAWYGTKVLHVGTNADSITITVDGEVIHKE